MITAEDIRILLREEDRRSWKKRKRRKKKKRSKSDPEHDEAVRRVMDYSVAQFDKHVLFIASGALGISFAFIEKIIPDLTAATSKGFMFWSWYLFASVIFISLVTHYISILAQRWAIRNSHKKKRYLRGEANWNYAIDTLNVIMMVGLLIGLSLLIYFVCTNT